MCRRKSYRIDSSTLAAEGAYEGQTMRLDQRDIANVERRVNWRRGFPWWMLWLIWPLIGLTKWFVPLYVGAVTAVFTQLSAAGVAPFVAFALIVVGLVLISRK
jgi:hypothetical protein